MYIKFQTAQITGIATSDFSPIVQIRVTKFFLKSCDLLLWQKFSRQWVFDACAFSKNQIERKTRAHNPSQTTKKIINGLLIEFRFPICTGCIEAKSVAWIEPMRADRFLFLLRQRGISRQALGGPNDDKFMQLRRCQRTFAGRCAPPRLKYFC